MLETLARRSAAILALLSTASACGAPPSPAAPSASEPGATAGTEPGSAGVAAPTANGTTGSTAATASASSTPGAASTTEGAGGASAAPARAEALSNAPDAIRARLAADLEACFEAGKKATPELSDAKLVLNVAIGEDGRARCVVPTDGVGIPREVAACMTERATALAYAQGEVASVAVPVAIAAGRVGKVPDTKAPVLEKVEAEGIPNAGRTLDGAMKDLRACVRAGISENPQMHGVLRLAARVGAKGEIVCAVATRGEGVPNSVRACTTDRLAKVRFGAPKWGTATLAVPLKVVAAIE